MATRTCTSSTRACWPSTMGLEVLLALLAQGHGPATARDPASVATTTCQGSTRRATSRVAGGSCSAAAGSSGSGGMAVRHTAPPRSCESEAFEGACCACWSLRNLHVPAATTRTAQGCRLAAAGSLGTGRQTAGPSHGPGATMRLHIGLACMKCLHARS